jgi:hypothetical protein
LYGELEKLLIKEETNLSTMSEPLVFWAIDDTVEPGKNYRYRVRLGVFNPVAGTEKVSERDESSKDDTILWSAFSNETKSVHIPKMLYIFPLRVAAKVVTFQVSRYLMGYWYNWNFVVQQGETIGTVVQNKAADAEEASAKQDVVLPESVDYSTGAVLVDVTTVNGSSGAGGGAGPTPRSPSDVLCSYDGKTMEHLPVGYGSWPKELQIRFNEIKKLADRTKKPWRRWADTFGRRSRYVPTRTSESSAGRGDDEGRDSRSDGEEEAFRRMMERRGKPR